MKKATLGTIKIGAMLGAFVLVLAFLGLYIIPAFATPGEGNGPIFSFNGTNFQTGVQYNPATNYGFQINITNETGTNGAIANRTFELGRPVGTLTNYTANSTIAVTNYTNLTIINFTQIQLGPAGTYNFTWHANDTTPTGTTSKWNSTPTIVFSVAQNTTWNNITIFLNNVSSAITYPRGVLPLNITAQSNITGAIINIYSNYTGSQVLLSGGTGTTRVENSTNLRSLNFGIYNITADLTAQNYSYPANSTLLFTLNSSTINFIMNLTYVNSSGYVSNIAAIGTLAPQFLAQAVLSTTEAGCTGSTTNFSSSSATIGLNNTCNYTATVTMTDFISTTDQIFNSTFEIRNLNMTSAANPISADIQLAPLGTYGKNSPSLKSVLGGFAFNDTDIRATSGYQNVTFALARRGYMPDGLYKCANWNQSRIGENSQVCSNWESATIIDNVVNTTYLNKTITTQNFTFYGYSEPFYNLRPLVKGYENASNITAIDILSWANLRAKYYSWVPMMKFNMTSKQPYLPSSDAYADSMYYDRPFFANPAAIEMLAYNLTVNMTFAALDKNQIFKVSITPRIIRSGETVLSGIETPLMPAWSVPEDQGFQGENFSRTVLRPTFNTLYYSYNGTNCGPYISLTTVGSGGSPRSVFTNSTLAAPCDHNVSYDYTNNEMNLTLPNVTNPVLSVLFSMAGRPTTGMYSPVYLVNQTFLGGFVPGPDRTPPTMGTASTISFMAKVNNSLSNFTSASGTDMFIHFLYPKNVTLWQSSSTSTINMTVNMGSNFQLWQLNDTISARTGGPINASASSDVLSNGMWVLMANETHLWNTSVSAYNSSLPVGRNFIVNRTFSCSNSTDNFGGGSPSNGKNITLCFQEFDFNLTSINDWLPNDPKTNVTLNLTASLNVSILNSVTVGSGGAGTSNQFNASISTASAGEINLTSTQLPGFTSGNCGSDFGSCSKTIIVDGQTLNTSSYRTGSIVVNIGSGTHAVSVSYSIPAATTAATTTTSSAASGAVVEAPVTETKLFSSIAAGATTTLTIEKSADLAVQEIAITAKEAIAAGQITVKKLTANPVTAAPVVATAGTVYKYLDISRTFADTAASKIKLKFKLEKSWLTNNSIDESKVALNRYADNKWNKLTTTKLSSDATYAYYEAEAPGLSYFAITGEKTVAAAPTPTNVTTPTPTNVTTPVTAPTVPVSYTWIIAAIVVIVIAGLGYLFFFGKKKK